MGNTNRRYDWKRYWCPREGRIWFDAEGYLLDPELQDRQFPVTDAVSFQ
jgi:hypothetical protein